MLSSQAHGVQCVEELEMITGPREEESWSLHLGDSEPRLAGALVVCL